MWTLPCTPWNLLRCLKPPGMFWHELGHSNLKPSQRFCWCYSHLTWAFLPLFKHRFQLLFALSVLPTGFLSPSKQNILLSLCPLLAKKKRIKSIKSATPSAGQKNSLPEEKDKLQGKLGPFQAVRRDTFLWKKFCLIILRRKKKNTGRQYRLDHFAWWETWKPPAKVRALQCWQPCTFHQSLSKTYSCNYHPLKDTHSSGQQVLYLSSGAPQRWYKSKLKIHIHKTLTE